MKIHAALKYKNRIAGDVKRFQAIIGRENSIRSDRKRNVDLVDTINKMNAATQKLIEVKSAIQRANAGIATELAKMAEVKGQIAFLMTLPAHEGEVETYHQNPSKPPLLWDTFMSRSQIDAQIEVLQKEINTLQDTIDAFNATTEIDIVAE